MRKLWAVGVLILLVLGCATPPARRAKEANTTSAAPPANVTANESTSNSTDDIRVRRLSAAEVEQLNRNTQQYENLRDKRYSTRIDLTEVDAFNCRSTVEDLDRLLDRLADDVDELEDELDRKELDVAQAKQAYDQALASGDEFEIKTARFDYNDAENEYDDVKKEAKQAHDDYDETERTRKVVDAECVRMRTDAGLRD